MVMGGKRELRAAGLETLTIYSMQVMERWKLISWAVSGWAALT